MPDGVYMKNGQRFKNGHRVAGPPPPDGPRVTCTDCGTTRPQGMIDCPVCDVPAGHVHGRFSAPASPRTEATKEA